MTLLIVALLHGIYLFLKQNLTTPVVHDLITKPTEKYREIDSILREPPSIPSYQEPTSLPSSYQEPSLLPQQADLKGDLKNYLKTLTR